MCYINEISGFHSLMHMFKQTDNANCSISADAGNESVRKIIINDTIFSKL